MEHILSKFARQVPFHKEFIISTLEENIELIREKADPAIIRLLEDNLDMIKKNGHFYTKVKTRTRKSKEKRKRTRKMSGGAHNILAWTIVSTLVSIVMKLSYDSSDRNIAIVSSLGVPYLMGQMTKNGFETIKQIIPMTESMDTLLSYVSAGPVLPEDVLKAAFESQYQMEPFTQQYAFDELQRDLHEYNQQLILQTANYLATLVQYEKYVADKEQLKAEFQEEKKRAESKGFVSKGVDVILSLTGIETLTDAEKKISEVLKTKAFQLHAYNMGTSINTTALAGIFERVMNKTTPNISLTVPNRNSTKALTLGNFHVNPEKSDPASLTHSKRLAFSGDNMNITTFLKKVLDNGFTLPPIITNKNTLLIPKEFVDDMQQLQQILDMNENMLIQEKNIILNIVQLNYIGVCNKVVYAYQTSRAASLLKENTERMIALHNHNKNQLYASIYNATQKEKLDIWVKTYSDTFPVITDAVYEEMKKCIMSDTCHMLTYAEVKNEKKILQKMKVSENTVYEKLALSFLITIFVVGLPSLLLMFVAHYLTRAANITLGLFERFTTHPMNMERREQELRHLEQMAMIEANLPQRGRLTLTQSARPSRSLSRLRLMNRPPSGQTRSIVRTIQKPSNVEHFNK